jgi:hypothetical protein
MMPKSTGAIISVAQYNRLICAPADWAPMPFFRDSRPTPPLIKRKLIEVRFVETKPQIGPIKFGHNDWRITDAGKAMVERCFETWRLRP